MKENKKSTSGDWIDRNKPLKGLNLSENFILV